VEELHNELKARQYKASPVRREYIPKANGKLRPLGIPVIKDRVVQAAVVLIIEPIFEADFEDCSYGFRPGRNAHQALERIAAALKAGKTEVYDADLEGYFDSIPHDKLMKCVRMRVVDGAVLGLIKQWLEAPVVEEIREEGKRERKPRYKVTRNSKGTPQGGVGIFEVLRICKSLRFKTQAPFVRDSQISRNADEPGGHILVGRRRHCPRSPNVSEPAGRASSGLVPHFDEADGNESASQKHRHR